MWPCWALSGSRRPCPAPGTMARPSPVTAFENVGKAYLAFARDEPALYAAMFESGLALDIVPALLQASDRAFAVLRTASEAVAAQIPKESRPPALMISLHMWAFAHGIASLFARGDPGAAQAAHDARGAAGGRIPGLPAGPRRADRR